MVSYIARQAIYNTYKEIEGYELLYRDGTSGNVSNIRDGDMATRSVLSDAITLFGLPRLTNRRVAYVNFTQNLIMNDFVYLVSPSEVVVELLEDMEVNQNLLEKLEKLKESGYTLALDDYTGDPRFDPLLSLVDIVKVDFMLCDRKQQQHLAKKLRKAHVTRLAEKVETLEDFEAAVNMGYTLFQGYFFEKPRIFNKKAPCLVKTSYGRMLNELQKDEVNFDTCARIVRSDVSMTYMIMQKVRSVNYYRGNPISGIKRALVMVGIGELRRYVILLLARRDNVTYSDELVRQAYLRGIFIEKLIELSTDDLDSEQGFLLGMFSLLDRVLGAQMEELLQDINLSSELKGALLGEYKNNSFAPFLQFVIIYEMANPKLLFPDLHLTIDEDRIAKLYMKCIQETDTIFKNLGG